MIVDHGVAIIELKIQGVTLNPTLIWDEQTAILVDAGMPGQKQQIKNGLHKAGISLEQLKSVILTHQDLDHIGSLPELINERSLNVYAHELDKPYIEGDIPLLKLDFPKEMQHLAENPPSSKVDETLQDGDELPYCGGIRVIFTPGHTPGHISLYLKQSKILIAGDALLTVDGMLRGPAAQTTPDMETAQNSLKAFLDFDIEKVICYHGGLCTGNINGQLQTLVNSISD